MQTFSTSSKHGSLFLSLQVLCCSFATFFKKKEKKITFQGYVKSLEENPCIPCLHNFLLMLPNVDSVVTFNLLAFRL